MSDLVLLHHDEPVTTSLALAACTDNEHDSVMLLIRKYADELREFGELILQIATPGISRFEISGRVVEIENRRDKKGRPTEFAFLNEPQSTLLITFMRNSPVVVAFKKALVKAFMELRDRLRGAPQPQFLTSNLSHGADLAVAADRTFRSFLRAGRSAGLGLPMALRVANRQTLERTGMNMLAELDVDPDLAGHQPAPPAPRPQTMLETALSNWLAAAGAGPWRMKQILREAIGMAPEHPDHARAVLAAASYLRSLGMTMRTARIGGGKTGRYWYRAGALEAIWNAVAVNPEKEA